MPYLIPKKSQVVVTSINSGNPSSRPASKSLLSISLITPFSQSTKFCITLSIVFPFWRSVSKLFSCAIDFTSRFFGVVISKGGDYINKLTNDVKYLLSPMYAQYLNRRKDNISERETRNFQNIDFIKGNTTPEWFKGDALDTCFEFQRRRCISAISGSNTPFFIHLVTEAIVALELEFEEPALRERIESVLDLIVKVRVATLLS